MNLLVAPAKLTWSLEVTGRRGDGYHELRSEMVTLELADHLEVDDSEDYLVFEPPDPQVALDATNLVSRALALVERTAGVRVLKSIPVGGGLGGGSADAAAILRWAGGVSSEVALSLGGDVPFCQLGGRATVEGAGELLTPLSYERRDVTLFMPHFGVDTASCYQAFDELWDLGERPSGRNHLEQAAGVVEPRLSASLAWLRAEFAHEVELAGSGSTMFVEGHLRPDAPPWDVQGPAGTIRIRQTSTSPR